jgi:transcriptional regulator with XRE-family HTH domain
MTKKKPETLAAFIYRIRTEKHLTLRDVEHRSANGHGVGITHNYVLHIEQGRTRNPSPKKIHSLARGLGITPEELFAAVQGTSADDDPRYLNGRFAALSRKFERVPKERREQAEYLTSVYERELERLAKR